MELHSFMWLLFSDAAVMRRDIIILDLLLVMNVKIFLTVEALAVSESSALPPALLCLHCGILVDQITWLLTDFDPVNKTIEKTLKQ